MTTLPIPRRLALLAPLAACTDRNPPPPPVPPRPAGYAYLTPLRLNVLDLEVVEAAPGPSGRADPPAPLVPAVEVARMGRDRLIPAGTSNRARFVVETAALVRERGSATVLLRAQVEILVADRRVAFAAAEARRSESGRAAADGGLVARAMDDLNVEFELQVRRNLRDWLLDGAPTDPVAPPGEVRREDLPPG